MSSKTNDGIPTPKVDSDIHTLCTLGDVSGLKSLMKKSGSDEINKPDNMLYVDDDALPLQHLNKKKNTCTRNTAKHHCISCQKMETRMV